MGVFDIITKFTTKIDGQLALKLMAGKLEDNLKERADRVCEVAKENAPVDTGALQDSGHVDKVSDKEYHVVFDAQKADESGSYALYVEEGTSKMAAQPFLRPALDAAKD
jgi:phage protein, HK97 gp10 family